MQETAGQDETSETRTLEKVQRCDFPAGLKVLLVDDDVICLQSVVAMLEECSYKVTATTKANEALEILRSRKDEYDIVITDVTMPVIDGFQLLKIISLEMDIPVIMTSANSDRDVVMKGINHGAQACLVKPIRLLELKNIWQHVIRKITSNHSKPSLLKDEAVTNLLPIKKRRDRSPEKEDDEINTPSKEDEDKLARKRPRFKWTQELHEKFVDVIHRLGTDVPKKILEIMKEPMLTREIIASHLQKFRETLKKQQGSMSHVRNNVYTYRGHGDLPNIISSYNHGDNLITKSETSTSSLANPNQRPVISSFYHPGMLPQQYILPPQMPNHIRPSEPVVVWLDYYKGLSQIPNKSPNQSDSSHFASLSPAVQHDPNSYLGMKAPLAVQNSTSGIHPYPFPPQLSSFNLGGTPFCVLRDGSTQTFQTRQTGSQNETIQSSLSDSIQSDIQYQGVHSSNVNSSINYTHLLTNNLNVENHGHHADNSLADDELMTLVQ